MKWDDFENWTQIATIFQGLQPLKNGGHLGQKIKIASEHANINSSMEHIFLHRTFCAKNVLQKTINIRMKWDDFENWKNGHNAKAIAFEKWSGWVKKIKLPKTCEQLLFKHIKDVLCKKRLKKTINIREMRRFWKLEKSRQCKGYSLWKVVSLGQKIKLPKTCEKLFYKHIKDVLCKKRLQKTINIREMRRFWKLEKSRQCKDYSLWKIVSLGQKIKLPKTCGKLFYKHIKDVLCKKRLQKTINIREMRRFWKLEKSRQCKGYSLWKVVSLGQKIKLPKTCEKLLYKHITNVLCKKTAPKNN